MQNESKLQKLVYTYQSLLIYNLQETFSLPSPRAGRIVLKPAAFPSLIVFRMSLEKNNLSQTLWTAHLTHCSQNTHK